MKPSIHVQDGFSLLELLVAFSIMAMSLGLLYRSMGGNVRQVAAMDLQQQATMVAESVLDTHTSVTAKGWNESGASAGFQWRVTSQVYASGLALGSPSLAGNMPQAVPLHEINLDVTWQDGGRPHQLTVSTLLPQRKPRPGEEGS
jgi:general secretion pathway protein I